MEYQIKKIQEFLKLVADGVFGPITIIAVSKALNCEPTIFSIQKKVGVVVDGVLGKLTIAAIHDKFDLGPKNMSKIEKMISIFKTQLGIHETSKNHGVGIEKYWSATNYPDGYSDRQPYCAACLCWVIRESGLFTEEERPKTPAAFGFEKFADNSKKVKINRSVKSVKKGDIVIFKFSHIGLATSDSDKYGDFYTIEANTGPSGGRDGDGVYEKVRNITAVRSTITVL